MSCFDLSGCTGADQPVKTWIHHKIYCSRLSSDSIHFCKITTSSAFWGNVTVTMQTVLDDTCQAGFTGFLYRNEQKQMSGEKIHENLSNLQSLHSWSWVQRKKKTLNCLMFQFRVLERADWNTARSPGSSWRAGNLSSCWAESKLVWKNTLSDEPSLPGLHRPVLRLYEPPGSPLVNVWMWNFTSLSCLEFVLSVLNIFRQTKCTSWLVELKETENTFDEVSFQKIISKICFSQTTSYHLSYTLLRFFF